MDAKAAAGDEPIAGLCREGEHVVACVGSMRSPTQSSPAFAVVIEANIEGVQGDPDESARRRPAGFERDGHRFGTGAATRGGVLTAASATRVRRRAGFCLHSDLQLLPRPNPSFRFVGRVEVGEDCAEDRRGPSALVLPDDAKAVDIRMGLGGHLCGQSLNRALAQDAIELAVENIAGFVADMSIPDQAIARESRGGVAHVGGDLDRRAGAGLGVKFAE
jgi:hypothetical protein